MNKYIDDVTQLLAQDDFQQYWPGFELVAYALYDEKFVYLSQLAIQLTVTLTVKVIFTVLFLLN